MTNQGKKNLVRRQCTVAGMPINQMAAHDNGDIVLNLHSQRSGHALDNAKWLNKWSDECGVFFYWVGKSLRAHIIGQDGPGAEIMAREQ